MGRGEFDDPPDSAWAQMVVDDDELQGARTFSCASRCGQLFWNQILSRRR
jgi:hypothetical protein